MRLKIYSFIILFCLGCGAVQDDSKGAHLLQQYCFSCHQTFDIGILPKHIYSEFVLPRMGARLGIYTNDLTRVSLVENELVASANIYPKSPLISESEWEILKQYILSLAPQELVDTCSRVASHSDLFKIIPPKYLFSPPSTIFTQINESGEFFVSDINTNSLNFLKDYKIEKSAKLPSSMVDMVEIPNAYLCLCIGSFSPTDNPSGSLVSLPKNGGNVATLADSLHRPVHIDVGDVDGDGDPDIVIAEFGKWIGGISLFINEKGRLKRQQIESKSGATKTYFSDINQDGIMDIVALFAQGNESITAYLGTQNGQFTKQVLLAFYPAMGSTYMELIDYDQDGDDDIIYTAGDNADYSPILKPYHGIYLYRNDGGLKFVQDIFLPMHGAYKAILYDFDQDHDLDIAAISFFPNFSSPQSGFQYFQKEDSGFTRQTLLDHKMGRWITLDSGDVDHDGDIDLILGSLAMEAPNHDSLIEEWVKGGIGYLILKNQLK